jgi:hypothetical protein
MNTNRLSEHQLKLYEEDGYVLVKGMLEPSEIELLGRAAREDRVLDQHSYGRADGEGGTIRLSLWNHPTATIYGMVARSESMAGCAEQILGHWKAHADAAARGSGDRSVFHDIGSGDLGAAVGDLSQPGAGRVNVDCHDSVMDGMLFADLYLSTAQSQIGSGEDVLDLRGGMCYRISVG